MTSDRSTSAGAITVIIPAYRAAATLPDVLDAVVPQADAAGAAVVVVESTADGTAERIAGDWPSVDVIALPCRTLPGRARNLAARRATTELVAFLDADAVPGPGWLDELVTAMTRDTVAVTGTIANGTPESSIGTAGWLLEFSEWLPGRGRPLTHATSASLLVRRQSFLAAGGFPEDLWPGEDTVLTHPWAAAGALAFAPRAVVHHRNRTGIREYVAHQRRLGEAFHAVCTTVEFEHGRFARRPWSAVAGFLRAGALVRRLRSAPAERRLAIVHAPGMALGLVAWSAALWRAGAKA